MFNDVGIEICFKADEKRFYNYPKPTEPSGFKREHNRRVLRVDMYYQCVLK